MFLFLLSTLQAQETTSLYSWVSSQSNIQDLYALTLTKTPPTIILQSWDQSSPKAYSRSLFAEPSLLSLLNRYEIAHELLPSTEIAIQHDIILLKQGLSRAQLIYKNKNLENIFFSIERTNLSLASNPFTASRLSSIEKEINSLLSTCTKQEIFEKDRYGNPLTWKGEECFFGNLILSYQPTEQYPIQAVFYLP